MHLRFFDFEVTPHYWLCVFGDLPDDWRENKPNESIKETFVTVTSDMPISRQAIIDKMRECDFCLVGYNIKNYDLMIANGIYQGFTPEQIKIINDLIIDKTCAFSTKEHMRLNSFAKRRMSNVIYLDLFDSSNGTLKDKESTLELSILESNVPFDKEDLTDEDKLDLEYYCKHDVWAAMVWYMTIVAPFINSKLAVAKVFNLQEADAYRCTNAQLVAKAVNAVRTQFADADRQDIELHPKIKNYINANLPTDIVNYVCNNVATKKVMMFKNEVIYADGGIHSTYFTNKAKKETDVLFVESDSEYVLINLDVSSFYPAIMIILDSLSRAIQNKERFKFVFEDRVRIKHKANKTKEDDDLQLAYKLILNTTYGAMGSDYLDLCDKYYRSRICRYGQLLLTALANKLYNSINSLSVVQTNTDGILVYVKRCDLDRVYALQKEWQDMSGMSMDADVVEKIWQRDVNNYLMVKEGGKIKRKGGWLLDNYIKPGAIRIAPLDCYAVGKAAIEYLVKDKDPIKTMLANTKLSDFVVNCMKGPTYKGVIQRMANGNEIELYKCNRVIATTDKSYGKIYKYKLTPEGRAYAQMPNVPEYCITVNDDLSTYDFNELKKKIDYMYYIGRLYDKLNNHYKQLVGTQLITTHQFDLDYL